MESVSKKNGNLILNDVSIPEGKKMKYNFRMKSIHCRLSFTQQLSMMLLHLTLNIFKYSKNKLVVASEWGLFVL